jgi:alanine racemase
MKVRTWLELDQSTVARNCQLLKGYLKPTCLVMGMIKSNAYSHGLVDYSQQLSKSGVNWLGVDFITEGLTLRRAGLIETSCYKVVTCLNFLIKKVLN